MVAMDVSRSMALGTTRALEARGDDLHHRVDSLLRAVGPDQHRASWRSRDKVLLSTQPEADARRGLVRCSSRPGRSKPSSSKTLMLPLVRHLTLTLKRMSVIFIVSDFVTDDNVLESPELAQLAAQARRRSPWCRRIARKPSCRPGSGYLHLRDLESGRRVSVGLGRQARAPVCRRRSASGARRSRARSIASRWTTCSCRPTGSPVLPVLSLFARRKA